MKNCLYALSVLLLLFAAANAGAATLGVGGFAGAQEPYPVHHRLAPPRMAQHRFAVERAVVVDAVTQQNHEATALTALQ